MYTMTERVNGERLPDRTVTEEFVENYTSRSTRDWFESLGGTETYRKRGGTIRIKSTSPDGTDVREVVFTRTDNRPVWTHDCEGCDFLGSSEWEGRTYDLYHCRPDGGSPTVIARYGSDGPSYLSGLSFTFPGTPLGEARARAIAAGLIDDDDSCVACENAGREYDPDRHDSQNCWAEHA